MGFGDLARDEIEVLGQDRDLREVDPRHAVLLRQGAQGVDLCQIRRGPRGATRAASGGRATDGPARSAPDRDRAAIRASAGAGSARAASSRRWTCARRCKSTRTIPARTYDRLSSLPISRPRPPSRIPSVAELCPLAARDGVARAARELAIEMQIVEGEEPQREDLAGHVEVAEVGARVAAAARRARALGVDGERIEAEARLLDDELPAPRQRLAVARVARREDAVEHVDAAVDGVRGGRCGVPTPMR